MGRLVVLMFFLDERRLDVRLEHGLLLLDLVNTNVLVGGCILVGCSYVDTVGIHSIVIFLLRSTRSL